MSQSKALSPRADETAFPSWNVGHGEAFPTVTSLDAGQDRENIAKTSAMPLELSLRDTSISGNKGSMQLKFKELMEICTTLQRQHSLMVEKIQSQDLEITQLKTRIKTLKDSEKRKEGVAKEDAPNKGRIWIKRRICRGLKTIFTTASTAVSPVVASASGIFPTTTIFTTTSAATPSIRITRSSRGVIINHHLQYLSTYHLLVRKTREKGRK
ncbi:hypothetical protein Tco_1169545 [Tanacetum coccineum]